MIFSLSEVKKKTAVYDVLNRRTGDMLGYISWYPQWRQYTFTPDLMTLFIVGCLEEVSIFITELMNGRKINKSYNQ